jgi:predicted nucleic acid-binding protein
MATDPVPPMPLRVLIDTNVILDWLFDRKPWADEAASSWRAQGSGLLVGYMPASAVTDLFYIARRLTDIPSAFASIDRIFASLEILAVDDNILRQARRLPGNDFEDNMQIACAQAAALDLIVSRNTSDFAHASMPVIEPSAVAQYLSLS